MPFQENRKVESSNSIIVLLREMESTGRSEGNVEKKKEALWQLFKSWAMRSCTKRLIGSNNLD